MKSRINIVLASTSKNWFYELSEDQQKEYIEAHPHSKYAKATKTEETKLEVTDTPKSINPSVGTTVVDGKRLSADGSDLPEHIKKLALPPAWKNVIYNPDPEGSLLAIGRDSKNRAQYVYSEKFQKSQSEAKFRRIQALSAEFGSILDQNSKNRKSKDPKVKELSDCLHLIITMGLRPGSTADTGAEKQAYGATTLKAEHIVAGKPMRLVFTGKDGVALDLEVDDPSTAKMLTERAKNAGPTGELFDLSADGLSKYSHTLDGGHFKTKDFRTLKASQETTKLVDGMEKPTTLIEYKKKVREVAQAVSKKLGNTPTICLQSYIPPECFAEWRMGLES